MNIASKIRLSRRFLYGLFADEAVEVDALDVNGAAFREPFDIGVDDPHQERGSDQDVFVCRRKSQAVVEVLSIVETRSAPRLVAEPELL